MSDRASAAERLLLVSVAFGPLAFGCVEPWSRAMLTLLVALAAMLVPEYREVREPMVYRALLAPLLLILGLGLAQWLNARPSWGPSSLPPFTASEPATRNALVIWSTYALWVATAVQVFRDRVGWLRLLWTIFLVGAVIACLGLVQKADGDRAMYFFRIIPPHREPFGPLYDKDHAASLLAMSALVGLGLFGARWSVWKHMASTGNRADLIATQAMRLLPCIFILAGLEAARSRAGMLAFLVALAVGAVLPCGLIRANSVLRGCICAGMISAVLLWFTMHRWSNLEAERLRSSAGTRVSLYRAGARLLGDFPLFGVGLGAFSAVFPPYQGTDVSGLVEHAHSDWLEILIESGCVGFVAVALGIWHLLLRAFRRAGKEASRERRLPVVGALLAALAFILHNFVEFSFHIPGVAVVFLGVMFALACHDRGKDAAPTENAWPRWMSLAIRSAAAGLALFAARPAIASWYAERAGAAPLSAAAGLLENAIRWDPAPEYRYRLGAAYLSLSDAEPASRPALLLCALEWSRRARQSEPFNKRFRALEGAILWRLGRVKDATGRGS